MGELKGQSPSALCWAIYRKTIDIHTAPGQSWKMLSSPSRSNVSGLATRGAGVSIS